MGKQAIITMQITFAVFLMLRTSEGNTVCLGDYECVSNVQYCDMQANICTDVEVASPTNSAQKSPSFTITQSDFWKWRFRPYTRKTKRSDYGAVVKRFFNYIAKVTYRYLDRFDMHRLGLRV